MWRQLILYVGPVAFSGVLRDEVYRCFLHSASYILSNEVFLQNFSASQEFLENFVAYSSQLFGVIFVTYNIHGLLHWVSECLGNLTSFGAYPFENELRIIKFTIHK